MNEQRPKETSSTYTPSPEVPQELAPRVALILEVLSGAKTVSEAAREANLSRNHFQSLLNRSLGLDGAGADAAGAGPKTEARKR